MELIQGIGRQTANITGDARETSSCPLHCRGEMRSHSKARSLPASLLQIIIFISFLYNNNNNNNNKKKKNTKYSQLSSTHIFFPVAIETAGTWHIPGCVTDTRGRKTDGQHPAVTLGRPPTYSSSCPLHYRGEMRSHSKARSLPASLLQFVIFISFPNLRAYWVCPSWP